MRWPRASSSLPTSGASGGTFIPGTSVELVGAWRGEEAGLLCPFGPGRDACEAAQWREESPFRCRGDFSQEGSCTSPPPPHCEPLQQRVQDPLVGGGEGRAQFVALGESRGPAPFPLHLLLPGAWPRGHRLALWVPWEKQLLARRPPAPGTPFKMAEKGTARIKPLKPLTFLYHLVSKWFYAF